MIKLAAFVGAAVFAAGAFTAAPALAQFAKPEDAIKYRKSVMTVMASHFGRIAPVVRGDRPFNAAEVQNNAAIVETMSKLPFEAYGPGTDRGDSRAKAEVWSNADKFKASGETMQKAVAALSAAARAGSADQVKAAFGDVGKACKGCHDEFRKD